MKKLLALIFTTVWVCLVVNSFGQTPPTNSNRGPALSEADLRKSFADTIEQVNAFYKTEGFPIMAPSADLTRFRVEPNPDYQEMEGCFSPTEQALVSSKILAKSGKIIFFCNLAASNAFEHSPKYETPPPARWTKDHAIEVASKFADIFVKPWGKSLSSPEARYDWQGRSFEGDKRMTSAGMWTVSWMQQTPSGILYRIEGVAVDLSEEFGPDTVFIHFQTQYDDDHITPLAKDKAIIEARKGLDKILAWGPTKDSFSGAKVQGEPEAELMIVQPNNITAQKSITDAGVSNQLKARLAWVVTYKVLVPSGAGDGTVDVYIDAKDGSFLGGFF